MSLQHSFTLLIIPRNHKIHESHAESRWCMDELVKIKKLADKEKLRVIPIFYKVRPRDVRKQTGEFGDNFWTLARASSGDQIKKWKEALGCILSKASEADFVKEIAKEVVRATAAIGLEEEEKHFGIKKECNYECELPDFKRSKKVVT
ncbi:unnamed protein product [Thlaspi arvense]|uniref:TIR domain-containing protein n=1 Tax=Thlaspi arvense TaxID=13288 RepID=A0AAU9RLN3_THLAR|nr:unnamed protein product [Thlaspi arvense]